MDNHEDDTLFYMALVVLAIVFISICAVNKIFVH